MYKQFHELTMSEVKAINEAPDTSISFDYTDIENAIFDLSNSDFIVMKYVLFIENKKLYMQLRGSFRKKIFIYLLKDKFPELYEKYKLLITEHEVE